MSRPVRIDEDELRESLRATFLELGPAASTQELARRAGVSEGTLFRRFGTKERLFSVAMQLPNVEDCEWFQEMLERAGTGSLEEHLATLAHGLHAFISELVPRLQMIGANGKLTPEELKRCLGETNAASPRRMNARFARYFSREMELGRMRDTDAGALASFFIGAVVHEFHVRHHFPSPDELDDVSNARRLAKTFAELVAVPPAKASRGKS